MSAFEPERLVAGFHPLRTLGWQLLRLTMSLRRYLLIFYAVLVAALLCIGLASKPRRTQDEYEALLAASVLVPIFTTIFVAALASRTPAADRNTFWSYKWSNLVILFPLGLVVGMMLVISVAQGL